MRPSRTGATGSWKGRLGLDIAAHDGPLSVFETEFVNSHGIASICDVRPSSMQSDATEINRSDYESIQPDQVVYVIATQLPSFLSQVFHKLECDIVLVTGDADVGAPVELWSRYPMPMSIEEFVEDTRVIKWFTQNCDIEHPKVSPIPVGMDYHTLARKKKHRWGPKQTPSEQESVLKAVLSSLPRLEDRPPQCLSNFHLSLFGDRVKCYRALRTKPFVLFQSTFLPREEVWKMHADFSFVISPEGNGMDCHRTWEALVLGAIPVVKRNRLTSLFKGLPVMSVKDWNDLDENMLDEFKRSVLTGTFNMDKVTLGYWSSCFRQAACS